MGKYYNKLEELEAVVETFKRTTRRRSADLSLEIKELEQKS